ncbi:hypothetical protein KBF61_03605 [Candidatus Saccharibacteria bacterium]|nr:hypothetical protein [Candidatus Saccharibacteria bacterium]
MYAGAITHKHDIQWLGAHQKFNRVAHRLLIEQYPDSFFPDRKGINKFEGTNGPDGIKAKSPSQNEPWHYYDPLDDNDTELIELLEIHLESLTDALIAKNIEKAAFEASWLSHGITDGLTPAHHHPYEKQMQTITGLKKEERTTKIKKIFGVKPDETKRMLFNKNWKLWGTKGLFTTHYAYEIGVATTVIPMKFSKLKITDDEIAQAQKLGLPEVFKRSARQIAKYHMYERFYRSGWSVGMARDTRQVLAPAITKTIAVAWAIALEDVRK